MAYPLSFTPEVRRALDEKRPVVALESTIIAHGMPYPQNVETARAVEDIVRQGGAVPATIAIIGGVLKVGLTPAELDRFGRDGRSIDKVSVRDLPFIVAQNLDGATTVASTMRIAAMAGIHVFATGGIGGVHRGAERTFDISADMTEFAASDVAVVTAGAKAILDLALTLEMLETLGVPVIGLGTGEFPAFYSRNSGHPVPMTCQTPAEIAGVMRAKWAMGLRGGVVVANPIPADAEIPAEEIAPVVEAAVKKAAARGIMGKETTPFLLAEIADVTAGRSLAANIALVKHNSRIAADIAVAFAESAS
ncbi:MAG: pseudouridine-5'-phosphate glycosidase [Aestuariivirga sp.]|uniref:pseudouridine-5'-phosphate glycosidase n=1 Tax=Aestuariivirga sp. TaxID=2650926 RepID=UPI0025C3175E|nr:pseudouridine-5'-phosphate glycosidase [Aestuariivirga sp.]MCA3559768.1 pseudouridine-5'-phosphate glycosidase [Aestuariivirga sp.]